MTDGLAILNDDFARQKAMVGCTDLDGAFVNQGHTEPHTTSVPEERCLYARCYSCDFKLQQQFALTRWNYELH